MKINKMITQYKKTIMKNKTNKYIVMHYVGGVSSAKNNCIYCGRKDARDASAHYFVDDTGVYQCVEDNHAAWHCGAKSYRHKECRNSNSLGIEMCCQKNSKGELYISDKTIVIVSELVKELMQKYRIDENHIVRHYDVTGKLCPNCNGLLNTTTWLQFRRTLVTKTIISQPSLNKIKLLQDALNKDLDARLVVDGIIGHKTTSAMKKVVIKKPKSNNYELKNLTRFVQSQLNVVADGLYGQATENSVKVFQQKNKLAVDGIVGYNTLITLIK